MKRHAYKLLVLITCFLIGVAVFFAWRGRTSLLTSKSAVPSEISEAIAASPIRKVDFLNFTYPNISSDRTAPSFTLVNGSFHHSVNGDFLWGGNVHQSNIIYGDLTGDGEEEAVVEMFFQGAHPDRFDHFVYVYSIHEGWLMLRGVLDVSVKPRYSMCGHMGGIQKISIEDGGLVLDVDGENTVKNGSRIVPNYTEDCYGSFSRVRFEWDGHDFRQKAKVEIYSFGNKQD
jgi:hypothetical protein